MKEAKLRGTDAYMIERVKGYDLQIQKDEQSQPKFVHQDLDKTYISKCFARLKRYKKEPQQIAMTGILMKGIEFIISEGPSVHIYREKYLVLYTSRIVHVLEWIVEAEGIRYQSALLPQQFDEDIVCLDIFEGYPNPEADPEKQPNHHPYLNIAIVTRNQNNVYKLYRNNECEEINDNIYGVTFMEDGTLVLHLDREVIIYPYQGGREFDNRKQIEKRSKELVIRTGNIEMTLTRSYGQRIFAAYVVSKGPDDPSNLVLDSFRIENKELKEYKQHVLERYDACNGKNPDLCIVDMMIVETAGELSVLLMLKKQVLVVKMKDEPKIECPYEWDSDQNIYMLNPRQLNPNAGKEDLLLLVRYSKLLNDNSKEKENFSGKLILLNVKSYENSIKQEFETSLRDIITINEDDRGVRRLLPCCIIGGSIVFIFYKDKVDMKGNQQCDSDSLMIEMFHTTSIEPFEKLKKLLPNQLNRKFENHPSESNEVDITNEKIRHTDTYIPKADLKMLLILNETYKTNNESSKNLYMCVWENIKQLLRSGENDDPSYLEAYTGYLYKTGDLEYVGEQLKEMIERGVKIDSFLKKHFLAVKKMAKERLEEGEKEGNFQMYLKATFYIKKLNLLQNQSNTIKTNEYNNWKRKDIRVSFLDDIRSRDKPKVSRFINLFKSYFVWNYGNIIEDLMSKEPTKPHTGILDYYKDMLPLLLPRYIEGKHKFETDGAPEQTCFDDLKFDANKDEKQLMRYKKVMEERYMRNNDFLFVRRKQVVDKEKELVDDNQAIYTFLSIINHREILQEASSHRDLQSNKSSDRDLTPSEAFIHFLFKNKYIDLALKVRLTLYIELFSLYKTHIDPTQDLRQFLTIDVAEIFCNIVFHEMDHDRSYRNIEFLLREVAAVWDPINIELDEQILKQEQTMLNQVDIENTRVFESYLRECFEIAHNKKHHNDIEILDKCKIFLEVIVKLQHEHHDKQLIIEKLIIIIFQYLRTDYVEAISDIYQLFKRVEISENLARDLFRSLEIVRYNIKFFQDFQLAKTIAELENREENEEHLRVNCKIVEEILNNYLRADPPIKEVEFQRQSVRVDRLKNLLDLLIRFTNEFYRPEFDESMTIFELFVKTMIKAEQQQPRKLNYLEEMIEIVNEVEARDRVFYNIIKNAIKEAKAVQAEKPPAVEKVEFQKSKPPLPPSLERVTSIEKQKESKSQSSMQDTPKPIRNSLHEMQKPKEDSMKQSKEDSRESLKKISSEKDLLQLKVVEEAPPVKEPKYPKSSEATQAKNDDMSYFISKCLKVLNCSKEMAPFVTQEKLILKLQQGKYQIDDLESLKREKVNVMKEISDENRRTKPKRSHQEYEYGNHTISLAGAAQNHDGESKLRELFEQSVSSKCDDYVREEVKGTADRQRIKEIVYKLSKAVELFEPLYFFLKLFETSALQRRISDLEKLVGTSKGDSKESKEKQKERKTLRHLYTIRCGLVRDFCQLAPVDVEKICQFIDDKWHSIMSESPQERDASDVQINSLCDIEMYFYVENYLKQAKYFAFVQLMYHNYERAARFFLRYRSDKRLGFDVASISSLVKIFMKHNKNNLIKNLRLTIQMLANVAWGNFEIFRMVELAAIKKDMPKPTDKVMKVVVANLEYFFDLYSHYSRESFLHEKNVMLPKTNSQGEKGKIAGDSSTHKDKTEKEYKNEDPPIDVPHEFLECAERLFNEGATKKFIEVVERSLEKNEKLQAELSSGTDPKNHFSMYFFRLFVRCVKFDEKLIALFPFDIFRESKPAYIEEPKERNSSDMNLRGIFQKHLKDNIRKCIDETNYIQIAKAIRFGFNNFADLELEIILIYLQKMIREHRTEMDQNRDKNDFNEGMEEYRLQRKIKSVLDNIDTAVLRDDRDRKRRQQFVKAGVQEKQLDAILQSY